MAKHYTHQRLPHLTIAIATLMPYVVLQATFDASASVVAAELVVTTGTAATTVSTLLQLSVHRHEMLQLLVNQDQATYPFIRW